MSFVSSSMKIAIALAGVASLAGCISAPTYGTGTSATTQLIEDLGDSVMLTNPNSKKNIVYAPRPDLVEPGKDVSGRALVVPQKTVASADNPNWVESPEDQRKRVYKEIEDNQDNPSYQSPLLTGGSAKSMTEKEQLAAFRKAKSSNSTIDITQRQYLIDPPQVYREASSPDALNNLGESERVKDVRRKKLAEGKDPDKCFLFFNCKNPDATLVGN